jgi:hypothetical protein
MIYAQYTEIKVFLTEPVFAPIKLLVNYLNCCERSYFGIPYDYRNGISVILRVSFCSLCWFCENVNYHNILLMERRYTIFTRFMEMC